MTPPWACGCRRSCGASGGRSWTAARTPGACVRERERCPVGNPDRCSCGDRSTTWVGRHRAAGRPRGLRRGGRAGTHRDRLGAGHRLGASRSRPPAGPGRLLLLRPLARGLRSAHRCRPHRHLPPGHRIRPNTGVPRDRHHGRLRRSAARATAEGHCGGGRVHDPILAAGRRHRPRLPDTTGWAVVAYVEAAGSAEVIELNSRDRRPERVVGSTTCNGDILPSCATPHLLFAVNVSPSGTQGLIDGEHTVRYQRGAEISSFRLATDQLARIDYEQRFVAGAGEGRARQALTRSPPWWAPSRPGRHLPRRGCPRTPGHVGRTRAVRWSRPVRRAAARSARPARAGCRPCRRGRRAW